MPFTICFDMGGTRIKSGMIENGKILMSDVTEVQDTSLLSPILDKIRIVINKYIRKSSGNGDLVGIGMAFPSVIDNIKKLILSHYVKYSDASEIDLNQWSLNNWGVPISIQNDAKAALLGEWKFGAGIGYNDLVMLTFGTGVGSGVLLNGKLLDGKDYIAGNLAGHSIISYNEGACNCGGTGCLEAIASSWSLNQKIKKAAAGAFKDTASTQQGLQVNANFKYLFKKAKDGDNFSKYILDDCLQAWGMLITNMVLAYNPDCIICGGGIMRSHQDIFPTFRKTLDHHGWIDESFVKLKVAEHPEYAALLGMHYAVLNENNT